MPYDGLPTLNDQPLIGKRVLLRLAYDVPLAQESGQSIIDVADDTRIRVTIPVIQQLLQQQCSVVICGGWLGRPNGIDPALRMDPVAKRLSELLEHPVQKLDDCVGGEVVQAVSSMKPGDVVLLENTRFHAEESANDSTFADQLASLAEVCVFDAFSQAHRTHASTVGLVERLPTVVGPLMVRELSALSQITTNPAKPFVVALGGAKLSDKIRLLTRLADTADTVLIGGAIANVFFRAKGIAVGASKVESAAVDSLDNNPIELAKQLLDRSSNNIQLPVDMVAGDDPSNPQHTRVFRIDSDSIPSNLAFYDIGPETVRAYGAILQTAKTVFWNGLMGVSEVKAYEHGTRGIASTIARLPNAVTVVGGGDTAGAVEAFSLTRKYTHVSTGGGASLAVVAGNELPVLTLMRNKRGSQAAV